MRPRSGSSALLAVACCFTLAAATLPARAADSGESYRQAVAAHRAGDHPAFLRHMRAAVTAAPDHPVMLYNLACGEALAGDAGAAIGHLQRLAAMGLSFDVAADEDLAKLRGRADFDAVRRAFARAAAPQVASTVARRLTARDLLVEGIAHDAATDTFLLSSVHRRKVLRLGADGTVTDLVPAGREGLGAPLGLAVDGARRLLWICSSGLPQMLGARPDELARGALLAVDLASGATRRRFDFASGEPGHGCNDLTVATDGTVYASDSPAATLLRLRPGASALEVVVAGEPFASPQGLALAADERTLYVADYARGLLRVDLASRAVSAVATPADLTLLRVDGLARHGDALLAIQNGFRPARVLRLTLAAGGARVAGHEVLEQAHPEHFEPTLGVVVGDALYYVAASGWPAFGDGATPEAERLREPVVLRLPLTTPVAH